MGIITTAAKQDADDAGAIAQATLLMATLNAAAADAAARCVVHAATDVTGFGLLGHLRNVLVASGCAATVQLERVPVLAAAWGYVRRGIAPEGTRANWRFLSDFVRYGAGVDAASQLVLCDAQTSGGMLYAVPEALAPALVGALQENGTPCAAIIGRVERGPAGIVVE